MWLCEISRLNRAERIRPVSPLKRHNLFAIRILYSITKLRKDEIMTRRIKTTRRRMHFIRDMAMFCSKNGQLLFLLMLMLLGALAATVLYPHLADEWRSLFNSVTDRQAMPTDLLQGCTAVMSTAFFLFVLLALLFLFGLTPYGWPLILCVPLFFGYTVGLAQCRAFLSGGLKEVLLTVLLPMEIAAFAVLIGAAQSLQMSALFSRQLLPSSAHCGGLWQDFKWYLLRFMLCIVIALAGAAVKIFLQWF